MSAGGDLQVLAHVARLLVQRHVRDITGAIDPIVGAERCEQRIEIGSCKITPPHG